MSFKATHAGSCQACGRVQKLPDGVLSKHGYTTRWGFFEGTCPGSGNKPFEQTCELVEKFIRSAQDHARQLLSDIDELNRPATQPRTRLTEYARSTGTYRHRTVTIFVKPNAESAYDVWYFTLEGKAEPMIRYSIYSKNPYEVATELNKRYAKNEVAPKLKQVESYIKWQQERIRNWKPAELKSLAEVR